MGTGKDIKCVVIGDSGVGKTSLLISYTAKEFRGTDTPVLLDFTKLVILTVPLTIAETTRTLLLCDTTYEQGYTRLSPLWYPKTDVFLICFSIASPDSFKRVQEKWIPEVQALSPGTPCVIGMRPVRVDEGIQLANSMGYTYVECSARNQDGVDEVFQRALLVALQPRKERKISRCVIL
ncbi:P-loop containing nucleoside triphosphate hydrolase protein [Aspergillus crustosus]